MSCTGQTFEMAPDVSPECICSKPSSRSKDVYKLIMSLETANGQLI